MDDLTVIVLAAGGGTRMRSKVPKVLHEVGGRNGPIEHGAPAHLVQHLGQLGFHPRALARRQNDRRPRRHANSACPNPSAVLANLRSQSECGWPSEASAKESE